MSEILQGAPFDEVKASGGSDYYKYGPTGTEMLIEVVPPGDSGEIKMIFLSSAFKGSTDKGVRMNDSIEVVKRKMSGDHLLTQGDHHLKYESGIEFGLDLSPRQVVTITITPKEASH